MTEHNGAEAAFVSNGFTVLVLDYLAFSAGTGASHLTISHAYHQPCIPSTIVTISHLHHQPLTFTVTGQINSTSLVMSGGIDPEHEPTSLHAIRRSNIKPRVRRTEQQGSFLCIRLVKQAKQDTSPWNNKDHNTLWQQQRQDTRCTDSRCLCTVLVH